MGSMSGSGGSGMASAAGGAGGKSGLSSSLGGAGATEGVMGFESVPREGPGGSTVSRILQGIGKQNSGHGNDIPRSTAQPAPNVQGYLDRLLQELEVY